ncbi:putative sulfate exporter family transporter [Flavobacterium sp. F-328]|uniref:Sulfate exporter family transporter n=2 Tax=Flavobacterium TaxID=237 RepID=A0ABR7JDR5_9FLAO|nr:MULTISPECIES: putative sulfate exporter family transporter [Flavobacterium]MBC5862493.1 putative sulfate exporter family transporter [Flavobacterium turcicum]MBQ0907106.1 putative sulfate exporter family transporter [Flavobacterium erciyesense]NHL01224.1 putative sulfate exporter family transporter [Flavobacterium turcicum]
MEKKEKNFGLHEDWTVVLIGFLIIAISLFVFLPEVPVFKWSTGSDLMDTVFSKENVLLILVQFFYFGALGSLAALLIGKSVRYFAIVFPVLYALTLLALICAGNSWVKNYNLEAVIFSLAIGLCIGNLVILPDWFRTALSTEVFVKIGLVLLGTSVIFSDILKAGSLGLIQALVVVLSVWYFAFWLCKKLKVDDELTMMISSAVSICGVSAAIATSGAIKGDSKKLSYVISMVLVTAIPMMIFMPMIAKYFNFPETVTGAWLGGSIDTSGAVVASGSLVGETALKISTIVKFSQNVLLGIAAFAISVYWTYTQNQTADVQAAKPTLGVIWERFPKFVLGFIAASLFFSFLVPSETREVVKESLKNIQGLWFALAFTSIGLETNFKELFSNSSKKPLFAFLLAQLFNVIMTLIVAFLLFE